MCKFILLDSFDNTKKFSIRKDKVNAVYEEEDEDQIVKTVVDTDNCQFKVKQDVEYITEELES